MVFNMSERSFPFDSFNHDRVYSAIDFQSYFKQFIKNGVFLLKANACQIESLSESDFQIKMNSGSAWCDGIVYVSDSDLIRELSPSHMAYDRIDRIVLRCDKFSRSFYLEILDGEPAQEPDYPTIRRDDEMYDLVLADVYVSAGRNIITNSDITDRRLDTNLCGICTGLIDQIDAEDFYQQMESAFNIWFQEMKDQLSTDAAGHLQLEIDEINDYIPDDGVWPISKGGTGADTIAEARDNLGLGNTSGPLPIANGGTGATTAEDARTNLEAARTTADADGGFINNTVGAGQAFVVHGVAGNASDNAGDRYYLIVSDKGISGYDASTSTGLWNLPDPVTIAHGGTGGTNASDARTNLEVPYTNNNSQLRSATPNTNVMYWEGIAGSGAGSSIEGHVARLIAKTNGVGLYDGTDSAYIWNLTLPVSIANGGTGNTTGYAQGFTAPTAGGVTTDGYGNLKHTRSNTGDYWAIYNGADNVTLRYYFDTGLLQGSPAGSSTFYNYNLGIGTYTISGYVCSGFITADRKQLLFFVPLGPFMCANVSITNLTLVVRHAQGGYIYFKAGSTYTPIGSDNTAVITNGAATRANELSSFSATRRYNGFTVDIRTVNYICINNTGTTVTNNIPVPVWIGSMTFTTS